MAFIAGTPMETRGYMSVMDLPDYAACHDLFFKSILRQIIVVFISSFAYGWSPGFFACEFSRGNDFYGFFRPDILKIE